ncbi:hypothetical protein Pcinc_032872 [Petrolisthes cinctipes]|uniref:Uncharacterized protein n=1 Tax=Petrolisthes cinctipes TaxID=88211 RepID=A0AAE1K2Q3_PETCI|nr:hypothetical protein Pcinc_032872 [Petrolisthes cinctipes]
MRTHNAPSIRRWGPCIHFPPFSVPLPSFMGSFCLGFSYSSFHFLLSPSTVLFYSHNIPTHSPLTTTTTNTPYTLTPHYHHHHTRHTHPSLSPPPTHPTHSPLTTTTTTPYTPFTTPLTTTTNTTTLFKPIHFFLTSFIPLHLYHT